MGMEMMLLETFFPNESKDKQHARPGSFSHFLPRQLATPNPVASALFYLPGKPWSECQRAKREQKWAALAARC
ncbi:hypothetical protein ACFX13_047526 [Malus domestica]